VLVEEEPQIIDIARINMYDIYCSFLPKHIYS